jgi:hypothetical protein
VERKGEENVSFTIGAWTNRVGLGLEPLLVILGAGFSLGMHTSSNFQARWKWDILFVVLATGFIYSVHQRIVNFYKCSSKCHTFAVLKIILPILKLPWEAVSFLGVDAAIWFGHVEFANI